jgi:hypothetical protein
MSKQEPGVDRWKEQAKYWQSLPAGSTALVFGGVFCMFAAIGLLVGIVNAAQMTIGHALLQAMMTGVFAIGWAFAGFRRVIWLMIVLLPLQLGANSGLSLIWTRVPALTATVADHAALLLRLRTEGALAIVMIIAGYVLVVMFLRKEGLRVFGAMTEVRLAREIHQALVPTLSRKIGDYEIYGASFPSGQVGGDLVDVIEGPTVWTAYIADIAGHGVPAGMVMAMVKSAARMGSSDGDLSTLLSDLNRVFLSLAAPNVFATFGGIVGAGGDDLTFALAGHLPILHYRKTRGAVEERSVSNLPLGIRPDAGFVTASIACEQGDVLAIVTDGLTEASDENEQELGLEPLKRALRESADAPLVELMSALRGTSLNRGKQVDDQTVLLVRRDGPRT